VVNDIRSFFHRVADGVKVASKQTWSAIRERFTENDEEQAPPSRRRGSQSKSGGVSLDNPPFADSKGPVPYRYDDADTFEAKGDSRANDETMPRVNVIPRDPARNGPFASPGEQEQTPAQPTIQRRATEHAAPDNAGSKQSEDLPETKSNTPPKIIVPQDDVKIEYARPIPGKNGIVYPPGAKESPENMVDVSGFQSGQMVRDPRTGNLFRVP
jgi:hypothetical protein